MTAEPQDAVAADAMIRLRLATRNAAALWTTLATTREHGLVRRPGFVAADSTRRGGLRILLLAPDPTPDDLAELTDLARRRSAGKVVVEDPFSTVDMAALGLTPRQLPVMIRDPAPVPASPDVQVTRVESAEQLGTVEDVVVHGFPLADFQPYRPGEVFPRAMLTRPGVELYLAARDGVPAGACLTITDDAVRGLYWVTTLAEHRSRGVGRALTHAALRGAGGLPTTLSSAKAGKPLYDSLGFVTLTGATWWS